MEYLDTYNENGEFIKVETRDKVHQEGLWHKTVHGWCFDSEGYIYFQIRTDSKKLYTTASGHVLSGETIKQALEREIEEEIGLTTAESTWIPLTNYTFKLDRIQPDGTIFKDRAFSNVFAYLLENSHLKFIFNPQETEGLCKIKIKEALALFYGLTREINGEIIQSDGNKNIYTLKKVTKTDFLINDGENLLSKYGTILEEILEITQNSVPIKS